MTDPYRPLDRRPQATRRTGSVRQASARAGSGGSSRGGPRRGGSRPASGATGLANLPALPAVFLAGILRPIPLALAIALVGSLLFILYGLLARDATQVPTLCAGFGVLGIVFSALAVLGALRTYGAARVGDGARSFAYALGGGIAALAAAGSFAVAVVLAMVWGAG